MRIVDGAPVVALAASPAQDRTSLCLSAQAAGVALRVADLVESTCTPDSAAAAVAFLQAWADRRDASASGTRSRRPRRSTWLVAASTSSAPSATCCCSPGCPRSTRGWPARSASLHPHGRATPDGRAAALMLSGSPRGRCRRAAGVRRLLPSAAVVDHRVLARLRRRPPLRTDARRGGPALGRPARRRRVAARIPRVPVETRAGRTRPGGSTCPPVRRALAALRSPASARLIVPSRGRRRRSQPLRSAGRGGGRDLVGGTSPPRRRRGRRLRRRPRGGPGRAPGVCVSGTAPRGRGPSPGLSLDLAYPDRCSSARRPGPVVPSGRRPVLTVPLGRSAPTTAGGPGAERCPTWTDAASVLAARHPLDPARDRRGGRRPPQPSIARAGLDLADVSAVVRGRAGVSAPAGRRA